MNISYNEQNDGSWIICVCSILDHVLIPLLICCSQVLGGIQGKGVVAVLPSATAERFPFPQAVSLQLSMPFRHFLIVCREGTVP